MNEFSDIPYLNAVVSAISANPETAARLRTVFPSYQAMWEAPQGVLTAATGEKTAEAILKARETIEPKHAYQKLVSEGITLISAEDPAFPPLLKEIAVPPLWLYIKGRLPGGGRQAEAEVPALAVVGARKATSYGREATERIIRGLAEKTQCMIVSGCAIGIDGEAHRSALRHNLPTIAVIGSGHDRASFYPPENFRLAEEIIAAGGAVVSEYPPETPAFRHHFIARNRIVAGLSRGALIVEAQEKSGALITARFALEQGRSVMAIPGSIFSSYSAGTHALIAEGARLVKDANDVMDELGLPGRETGVHDEGIELSESEQKILTALEAPQTVDMLTEKIRISTPDIISLLSMLELKSKARETGNGLWMRI